jgi:hypothetical protein
MAKLGVLETELPRDIASGRGFRVVQESKAKFSLHLAEKNGLGKNLRRVETVRLGRRPGEKITVPHWFLFRLFDQLGRVGNLSPTEELAARALGAVYASPNIRWMDKSEIASAVVELARRVRKQMGEEAA